VSLAKNIKISSAVIGLTVVAFGTSAPEFAISFMSHFSGNTDILFGNVIGSVIGNSTLIIGIVIIIKPFTVRRDVLFKEFPILFIVTMLLIFLILGNVFQSPDEYILSRFDGFILLFSFGIFIFYLFKLMRNKGFDKSKIEAPKYKLLVSICLLIAGLVGVIIGSQLVVHNLVELALTLGISQKTIAVTIIAIGTSLPELVTSIIAAKKGENEIAIGNIVGSNIFNICIVLGLPIAVVGQAQSAAFGPIDMLFMLLALALFWVFATTKRKLERYEGFILISVYIIYVWYVLC
jgi:cation:H+ antiporter